MKIHEYQAAALFKQYGIPVPEGRLTTDITQAKEAARELGYPVVLKAQVLVGGRGKAGGIKIVRDEVGLDKTYSQIHSLVIKDIPVEKIYVTKAVDFDKEYYCALTIDYLKADVVLIASAAGGVDIEQVAKQTPDQIHKLYFQGRRRIPDEELKKWAAGIFEGPDMVARAAAIITALTALFFEKDCSLAEINPLVQDKDNRLIAVDAKVNLDENGLFRHPELEEMRDKKVEEADELEAKQYGLSFVKMEGNIGCVVNGAGLAMTTMDVIKLLGGQPANFLDVGGSSNPQKVVRALDITLRNTGVKAVLINIFGGITRCDDIAKGLIEAIKQTKMEVPMVVRLTGTNEKEARALLDAEGIKAESSMRKAVEKVIKLAK